MSCRLVGFGVVGADRRVRLEVAVEDHRRLIRDDLNSTEAPASRQNRMSEGDFCQEVRVAISRPPGSLDVDAKDARI